MKHIIKLMRPHQYVKNLFILAPLFFVGQVTNYALLLESIQAFVAFSICASGVYVLNDWLDIEADKTHPKKKFRPLASGAVSRPAALGIMLVCFISGGALMLAVSIESLVILSTYVLLNIGYSFYLKHIAILDVAIISVGFVLRLFVGSAATGVLLSKWIVIMTFLLALFMALAKRRDDVLIFLNTGAKMRRSVDGYNLALIDASMTIMTAVVIVSYILYTTSAEVVQRLQNEYLYVTTLFVILGVLRYLQITYVEENSGSPTKIAIKDNFIRCSILAWLCSYAWIIYI